MIRQDGPFKLLRHLSRRFWITFLIACAIAEGGEFLFERSIETSADAQISDSLFSLSGLYQKIVAAPRKPIVRYSAIVEIDPARDIPNVSANNVCGEREFLAHLLRRINGVNPALIVIDKYFGPDTCAKDDPGTRDLQQAVSEIRQQRPVIVGLRTTELDLDKIGPKTPTNFIQKSLVFGGGTSTENGIVNIAKDPRRLPLQWLVYENQSVNSAQIVKDTLALATAKAFDPFLLKKDPRLDALLSAGTQPFIGFLGVDQFNLTHFYSSEVLCGRHIQSSEDWQTCEAKASAPTALRNRIVVIGENDKDRDEH